MTFPAHDIATHQWVYKNGYLRTFGTLRGADAPLSGMHMEKAELIHAGLAAAQIPATIVATVETAGSGKGELYEVRVDDDISRSNYRRFARVANARGTLDLRDESGKRISPPSEWTGEEARKVR